MYVSPGSSVDINNCFFIHNTIEGTKGIGDTAVLTNIRNISNSDFRFNIGSGTSAVLHADLILNSSFKENYSKYNGGTVSWIRKIVNSSFENNSGGVIDQSIVSISDDSYSRRNLDVINSIFINNISRDFGEAIFTVSNRVQIINSLFVNNTASKIGGAINGSNMVVINSTFVGNTSGNTDAGGAIYGNGTVVNSLFYNNLSNGIPNDVAASGEMHIDYTLLNHISGALNLGAHVIFGDPGFINENNLNFRLSPSSPARDAGNSNLIKAYPFMKNLSGQTLDLDSNTRPKGIIDLGVYESY